MNSDHAQQIAKAWQWRGQGKTVEALELLSALYQHARRSDDQTALLAVAGKLAHVLTDLEQLEEADELYRKAVQVSQQQNDDCQLAYYLRHLADLWRRQGRGGETRDAYQQAIRLFRSCGGEDSLELANAQRGLALWEEQHGQPEQALPLWHTLQVTYARFGVQAGVEEASQHIEKLTPQTD